MNDIYHFIRKLAKTTKYQNLFLAVKELHGLQLFHNITDLSKMQDLFLNYLYMYDTLNTDIAVDNISKHVLDNELYEDSYMLWRREKKNKEKEEDNKASDVKLVLSDKIEFPKR